MKKAFVVIRMDDEGCSVLVNQEDEKLTEEDEQWLAFLAIPILERFIFNSEDGRQRWLQARVGAKRLG